MIAPYQIATAIAARWKKTETDAVLRELGPIGQLARHATRLNIAAIVRDVSKVYREVYVDGYSETEFSTIAFNGDKRKAEVIVRAERDSVVYWRTLC